MLILLLLRTFFLVGAYKRNNPLISALRIIISLVLASPLLGVVSPVWYVFLLLMLFLRGIFVVVIYFARVSTYIFKVVVGATLLIFSIAFYPYLVVMWCDTGDISALYSNLPSVVLVLIAVLVYLMVFSSYILSRSSPTRTM